MTQMKAKNLMYTFVNSLGFTVVRLNQALFQSNHYLRHNARRLEHLSSLRIPVANMTVLEAGAGIGDHSHYYIDRGCRITITEARKENLHHLKNRYPDHDIEYLDMEHPHPIKNSPFDIVHCYGLLYHLSKPEKALEFLSGCCREMLFLETCVSFGDDDQVNLVSEDKEKATLAVSGTGCKPTRLWLYNRLQKWFEYVYVPKTQPNHEEFPLDWTSPEKHKGLARAIFIASRRNLDNEVLTRELLKHQVRHE